MSIMYLCIGMCVYSVVCYFVGIHLGYTFAFLGALLFVGFIIYDTDKIMKKMVRKKNMSSALPVQNFCISFSALPVNKY